MGLFYPFRKQRKCLRLVGFVTVEIVVMDTVSRAKARVPSIGTQAEMTIATPSIDEARVPVESPILRVIPELIPSKELSNVPKFPTYTEESIDIDERDVSRVPPMIWVARKDAVTPERDEVIMPGMVSTPVIAEVTPPTLLDRAPLICNVPELTMDTGSNVDTQVPEMGSRFKAATVTVLVMVLAP